MAKQVRPGLTNPAGFKGRQESADLIRRQPAYPIRARGQAPLTEAECMAAISTCFNRNGKSAWQRGASMYEPATPNVPKKVGAAFPHTDSGGFELKAFPSDGMLVVLPSQRWRARRLD